MVKARWVAGEGTEDDGPQSKGNGGRREVVRTKIEVRSGWAVDSSRAVVKPGGAAAPISEDARPNL